MKHRHALLATGAAGVLMLGGMATSTLPAAAAATGCAVTYTVQSQWPGGFTANVAVTNLGAAVSSWTLAFDFPERRPEGHPGLERHLDPVRHPGDGRQHELERRAGHRRVDSIGFGGSWSGANPVPASFTLNGTTCTGSVTTPTVRRHPAAADPSADHPVRRPPLHRPVGRHRELRVSGNKIVTAAGKPYRLLGVSRSGGEFACVQGKGLWDGGPVDQASVDAMKTWNIHAVRIPLNEECWLGVNGSPSGATYQQGVKDYVNLLVANGINADPRPALDLGRLHQRPGLALQGRARHLPEADAGRAVRPAVLDRRRQHVQGQRRRRLRPVQRALPGDRQPTGTRPWAGSACATAAPAPACPTRWPACRTSSTRSAPPAPPTCS